jgi:methylated-DNA-protein-cysteine methyltransferase-like protein
VVKSIPRGKVTTYGRIAGFLGGYYSGRVVGFAMRRAPEGEGLPCHRVINRLGEMAPGDAFGGAAAQRRLLEKEGVRFKPDGRVDFDRSLWDPDRAARRTAKRRRS